MPNTSDETESKKKTFEKGKDAKKCPFAKARPKPYTNFENNIFLDSLQSLEPNEGYQL